MCFSTIVSRGAMYPIMFQPKSSQLGHYKTSRPPIWDITRVSEMGWLIWPLLCVKDKILKRQALHK